MKALLTQLYFIAEFRCRMLEWFDSNDPLSNEGAVAEMRTFFAYMQQLENHDGQGHLNRVRTTENSDASEYFHVLMDELEDKLKLTAMRTLVKECFKGGLTNQIICREQVTVQGRVYPVDDPFKNEYREDFCAVGVEITGKKTISDALAGYVEGEILDGDNKYVLEGGVEAVAEKRVVFASSKLPRTLFLQLKRYRFDFESLTHVKINDRCEFPMKLNLEPYTEEGIERRERARRQSTPVSDGELQPDYEYELIGVITHTGCANVGAYDSYVKRNRGEGGGGGGGGGESPARWEVHRDGRSEPFDVDSMEEACFGGDEKDCSAYMLVYHRISASEESDLKQEMEALRVSAVGEGEREAGLEQPFSNLRV